MNKILANLPVKELLECAARMNGMQNFRFQEPCKYYREWGIFPEDGIDHTDFWNPLVFESDAFKLCLKLRLYWVIKEGNMIEIYSLDRSCIIYNHSSEDDLDAYSDTLLKHVCLAIVQGANSLSKLV